MESFVDILSKVEYGIAVIAAAWLLILFLRPRVIAFRAAVVRRAAAAKKSVSEASAPDPDWSSVKAE